MALGRTATAGAFVSGTPGVGPYITAADLNSLPGGWVGLADEPAGTVVSTSQSSMRVDWLARPDRRFKVSVTVSSYVISTAGSRMDTYLRYNGGNLHYLPGETAVVNGAVVAAIGSWAHFDTDGQSGTVAAWADVVFDHVGAGSTTITSAVGNRPSLVVEDIGPVS